MPSRLYIPGDKALTGSYRLDTIQKFEKFLQRQSNLFGGKRIKIRALKTFCKEIGVPWQTFYGYYKAFEKGGRDALKPRWGWRKGKYKYESELGKAYRTIYMIRYGMDMNLRKTVLRYTSRRENWNQFGRNIFHGFGGLVREKDQQSQAEVFWFLTVVQNAIVLWNALALDNAIARARRDDIPIREEDLKHMLPTMVEHINFVGQFNIDINRRPPFRLAA